tara:strand:+ start:248 stop:577 length:330 start_codon:yes stop_codon:yes gene_type:complete
MASFIKARYIDLAAAGDIQKYLTLNVENAYRVDVASGNLRVYYNIPSSTGKIWSVDMDFSGALAAVDAAQLESLITSVQQAPLSIETFLPQTDTDLVLMGFSVSEVLYP